MLVLVVNSGSSSLKAAVVDPASGAMPFLVLAERLGTPDARLAGAMKRPLPGADHGVALIAIAEALAAAGLDAQLAAVGHRVVHGGARFSAPARIDAAVIAGIEACIPFGPLHNPANLLGIRLAGERFRNLPQVAVFDTAFHHALPAHAYRYAVPEDWYRTHGVRRYGFHGINHQYCAETAVRLLGLGSRHGLVIAHLGNGCSATAVADGRSVDTTMGFTPLEGLVMGTRSGDLDPAVVAVMAQRLGRDAAEVVDTLNHGSGLLGLSGLANDVRTLVQAAADGHAGARLALEVFAFRTAKAVGALRVSLDRFDALVFTGGIGEHAAGLRAAIVARLGHLGLTIDPARNQVDGPRLDPGSATAVLVVPAGEELAIARAAQVLIAGQP